MGVILALAAITLALPVLRRYPLAVVLSVLFLIPDISMDQRFSHIALPKPPFFVTECFMLMLTIILVMSKTFKVPKKASLPLIALLFLVVIGVFLNIHKYGLAALRDAAELYYAAFIPLSYSVYRVIWKSKRTPYNRRHASVAILCLSIALPVFDIITRHSQVPGASESFLGILLFLQLGWHWSRKDEKWLYATFPLGLSAVLVQDARGPWVGIAIGLVCFVVLSYKLENGADLRRRLIRLFAVSLAVIVPVGTFELHSLSNHIQRDLVSIFQTHGSYYQVANNRWRLIVWGQALHQITQNPLAIRIGQQWVPTVLGNYGFSTVTTGYELGTIALSNSYLQIVQWWGLWPIVPLALLIVGSIKGLVVTNERGLLRPMQVVALASLAMWAAVIFVEVVLEGPYMSAVVWSMIGLGYFYGE
ncbi:O-antigen ligase family protein [Sulfobacillus harzensis]|uniref:O-antigen ligase family protein n=1 Tax=Sulfobacillus harzensis TaxID=2729629 RepID=A0A7Y0L7L5_9FIRM|nr:O-antigen ligase family protein [Sulfobacillus harzensis]NMP24788.1 O-antigen ligase family protein [Sulfobacillus harzensis]